MKLSKLIETLISEFREGFDLKLFLHMKSFAQQVRYANSNLRRMASGSARIIYEISDDRVLKLAKNAKGIAQNEVEGDWGLQSMYGDIISKVVEEDKEYRWIVSQRAKKITKSEFKSLVGIDIDTFFIVLKVDLANHKFTYLSIDKEVLEKVRSLEFYDRITRMCRDFDLEIGDFGRISSYGEVDGHIVITDYGLTSTVYQEFYRRGR